MFANVKVSVTVYYSALLMLNFMEKFMNITWILWVSYIPTGTLFLSLDAVGYIL